MVEVRNWQLYTGRRSASRHCWLDYSASHAHPPPAPPTQPTAAVSLSCRVPAWPFAHLLLVRWLAVKSCSRSWNIVNFFRQNRGDAEGSLSSQPTETRKFFYNKQKCNRVILLKRFHSLFIAFLCFIFKCGYQCLLHKSQLSGEWDSFYSLRKPY